MAFPLLALFFLGGAEAQDDCSVELPNSFTAHCGDVFDVSDATLPAFYYLDIPTSTHVRIKTCETTTDDMLAAYSSCDVGEAYVNGDLTPDNYNPYPYGYHDMIAFGDDECADWTSVMETMGGSYVVHSDCCGGLLQPGTVGRARVEISCSPDGGFDDDFEPQQKDDDVSDPCMDDCVWPDNPCLSQDWTCMKDCSAEFLEGACLSVDDVCSLDDPLTKLCHNDSPMGYCFSASSTVTALKSMKLRSTETKKIADLAVGDKVLAHNGKSQVNFKKVTGLTHSPSEEAFIEISTGKTAKDPSKLIHATLHHTFTTCSGKIAEARHLAPGSCLHTEFGTSHVKHVRKVPVQEGDITYTVAMEDGAEVAVGGVFTHSATHKMKKDSPKIYSPKDSPGFLEAMKRRKKMDQKKSN